MRAIAVVTAREHGYGGQRGTPAEVHSRSRPLDGVPARTPSEQDCVFCGHSLLIPLRIRSVCVVGHFFCGARRVCVLGDIWA
jgi:hypothetical protein